MQDIIKGIEGSAEDRYKDLKERTKEKRNNNKERKFVPLSSLNIEISKEVYTKYKNMEG